MVIHRGKKTTDARLHPLPLPHVTGGMGGSAEVQHLFDTLSVASINAEAARLMKAGEGAEAYLGCGSDGDDDERYQAAGGDELGVCDAPMGRPCKGGKKGEAGGRKCKGQRRERAATANAKRVKHVGGSKRKKNSGKKKLQ